MPRGSLQDADLGNNTPKKNRPDETAADQHLIDGLNNHAQTITSLVIAGVPTTTANIIAVLQARVDASKQANLTRATWQAAVKADHDERANTKAFVGAVRQAILAAFAGQIDVLADFGLTPRKKAVRTPEEKLAAVEKAQATRAARHTMGKKEKGKITGATPQGTPPASPNHPAPSAVATPAEPPAPQPQGTSSTSNTSSTGSKPQS